MKRLIAVVIATGALVLGMASAQAQFTYLDATDFSHPLDANDPNAYTGSGPLANTWLDTAGTIPWTTSLGNGDNLWRYRYSGPAVPAFGTTAYAARNNENDPPVYTRITGLNPGATYTIKLYGSWTTANNTWGLSYSLDGGSTWSSTIDRDTINFVQGLGIGQGWVDTSNGGVGAAVIPSGDSRGNLVIGTAVADGTGAIAVGVRGWPNTVTERGVYDGVAWAPGVVPEPTTFALAGLGAAAMLIFRRRR